MLLYAKLSALLIQTLFAQVEGEKKNLQHLKKNDDFLFACPLKNIEIKHLLYNIKCFRTHLVMGTGQKFLTRVSPGQFFVAGVGSAIYCLGLNLENFP